MLIKCPHCGGVVPIDWLGRKPLQIPVTNIYDAIRRRRQVSLAARELDCSPAYIYKVLKLNGLTPEQVMGKGPRH